MPLTRRATIAALAALPATAFGQTAEPAWPARPIRFIVAFPAGSGTDVTTRFFADPIGAAALRIERVDPLVDAPHAELLTGLWRDRARFDVALEIHIHHDDRPRRMCAFAAQIILVHDRPEHTRTKISHAAPGRRYIIGAA
jgi:hypothetical protein